MPARFESRSFLWIPLALVLLVGLGAGLAASVATAGDMTGRWGLGLEGGLIKLVEGKCDYSNVDEYLGLKFDRSLSPGWEAQLSYQYGYIRPGVGSPNMAAGFTFKTGGPYYTMISHPSINLLRRFRLEGTFSPKVGVGLGLTSWKVVNMGSQDVGLLPSGDPVRGYDIDEEPVALEGSDFTFSLDTGLDIFIRESVAVNLGVRLHLNPTNTKDNIGTSSYWGPSYVDANTGRGDLYLGVTCWFGNPDPDNDGIFSEFDACPDQPEDRDGFKDLDGCPDPDNDEDGIPDERDKCPDQPEDFDGFQDEDGCPEPDNDEDGIFDGVDGCPDEAEDMDGFQDHDGCPDLDNDRDGVPDELDLCPETPAQATVDQNGCPKVEEIQQSLVLEGVSFFSGSARLTPESLGTLSPVAKSLLAWPDVKIEIRGHTDSVGEPETNRDLSHRRALAVKDNLVHMGVDPSRITTVGYGEDYPLADNGSPEGRRINRRVEIHKLD